MSQKQTYTKEQLEALRDCYETECKKCNIRNLCHEIGRDEMASNICADLLSANEEIERLRAYIQKDDPCKTCTGNGCQSLYPSQCTGCGADDNEPHKNWALKGE